HREFRYVRHLHPNKSKQWRTAQYFGKLNPSRLDNWVFGDKKTGFYLNKFAWTGIQRHTMVTGRNSPDDPSLQEYWAKRERAKVKDLPPDPARLAKRQGGKCPICGESLFIEETIEQHHIVPRIVGGSNHDDNKLLVHLYCHQQLTAHQRSMGML
ncbi:MAG: HNH endonuclease, partial [Anaerolineae bacterium]|nr:HNH endonuclease [Anaerolineae bacterium]